MKLETKDLLCAINNIKPFIPSKSVVKGGKCFLIKVYQEGNPNKSFVQLKVIRDGLNISQTIECINSTEEDGVYLIPADLLDKYLGDLSGVKTLEWKKLKNSVKIKFSTGEFLLHTLSIAEIQKLELFLLNLPLNFKEESDYLEIKSCDLIESLQNGTGARVEKSGVYTNATIFNFKGEELGVYTTDGKKLNTSKYCVKGNKNFNFSLHGKTIAGILQILSNKENICKIWCYKNDTIVLEMDKELPILILKNLSQGSVPLSSIEGVIENVENNKESYSFCKVKTDELDRVLKRSFIYITKENLGISMEKKEQEIIFTGELQDVGEFRDTLSIERGDTKCESIKVSPISLKKSLPESLYTTVGILKGFPVILENGSIRNYVMPLRG